MSASDKAKNVRHRATGKVKEAAGAVTGNERLRSKGKTDQNKADLKQVGEKLKDAFRP